MMDAMHVVFLVHYFPPINSAGAKRVEALTKYFARLGHRVTVITTQKKSSDGAFVEEIPPGIELIELDARGRERPSESDGGVFEPMYGKAPSAKRRFKDAVMAAFGQLPEPRLPFALSFLRPRLGARVEASLRDADVVIGSNPPWPMLLAALIVKRRFGVPCILDYRDQFSECHEMPGNWAAKKLEAVIDRLLVRAADHIVTISDPMTAFYAPMNDSISTIMNGYDHELIAAARQRLDGARTDRIIIRYMGLISPGRVPHHFLDAVAELKRLDVSKFERLCIEFYGDAALVEQELRARGNGMGVAFRFMSAVPYEKSMELIVGADYLLFSETSSQATLSAQGILPTKLFEYIGSGRPILANISPSTLAGRLLEKCGPNHVVAVHMEPFLSALQSDEFYVRIPDHMSEEGRKLSRIAQAGQYLDVARTVAQRSSFR